MIRCLPVAALLFLCWSCADPAAPLACPASGDIVPARLAGSYEVRFTLDSSPGRIGGTLELGARAGLLRADLAPLGVAINDSIATVSGTAPHFVMRLGASLPDTLLLFDAAYFSIFLDRVDANGLGGVWRATSSEALVAERRGRFCAIRQ